MRGIFIFGFLNLALLGYSFAEVAESYKCKLKSGVSRSQIIDLGEDYIETGKKNGMDFNLSVLFPIYSDDMSDGVFYWNGTSSNLESLGKAIKIWESNDNKRAIDQWVSIVDGCESSSLFSSVKIN